MPTPSRLVRCTLCQPILPGWLLLSHAPDGAMLLYHLGAWHLAEAKPYLRRMEREDISAVLMELFARVEGSAHVTTDSVG